MTAPTITVLTGDALAHLRTMPDNSADAVITDPPYGLSNHKPDAIIDALTAWTTGDDTHVPNGRGFMGKEWDKFVPPPAIWKECRRVLKPGGHMAVFAGTRTQDLMGLSIRLAGFEIRDTLGWIYGSGFPKSMDISKAIDKTGGASPEVQARTLKAERERAGMTREQVAAKIGCSAASVRNWEEGRPRAKGMHVEFITPGPEYRDALADLLGYSSDEREIIGATDDRRGDGTVIGLGHSGVEYGESSTDAAKQWQGWGTALKPAIEPIILARKPLDGTVAQNVLEHGVGGLNIDGTRIGTEQRYNAAAGNKPGGASYNMSAAGMPENVEGKTVSGRFPANVLLDEHAAEALDEQSGASRFFPVFRYQAKAPKKERPVIVREDGTKVQHPTVKPVALMEWLVTLMAPPGAHIIDPFAGTGTTLQAARNLNVHATGIELDPEHVELIEQRLQTTEKEETGAATLF